MEPKCENVTRQDCVTKWEVRTGGRKVWAGNEDCKPVTWMKCELVPVNKLFNQASQIISYCLLFIFNQERCDQMSSFMASCL